MKTLENKCENHLGITWQVGSSRQIAPESLQGLLRSAV